MPPSKKSRNGCANCPHTWTPRSGKLSERCPKCRSTEVRILDEAAHSGPQKAAPAAHSGDVIPPPDLAGDLKEVRIRVTIPVPLAEAISELTKVENNILSDAVVAAIRAQLIAFGYWPRTPREETVSGKTFPAKSGQH